MSVSFDRAVRFLLSPDAEAFAASFADCLVDAVELEQPTKVRTDFLLNVSIPPVGGEFECSVVLLFQSVGGNVVGAVEPDDIIAAAGLVCVTAGLGVLAGGSTPSSAQASRRASTSRILVWIVVK